MELLATRVLALLLLPPGLFIVLLLTGLFLCWRAARRGKTGLSRSGTALILGATVLLYLASLSPVGNLLSGLLEHRYPALPPSLSAHTGKAVAQAIVILGGGRRSHAPEFGTDTVSRLTLERLRYGARLARETGLPVLVSGGRPFSTAEPEAALMATSLREDFGVRVRWQEGVSRTTWENAVDTRRLLAGTGIRRIYLVTHARHMPRAVYAFRAQGFHVIPAPTGFTTADPDIPSLFDLLPSARALNNTYYACWEGLGLLWYHLRY